MRYNDNCIQCIVAKRVLDSVNAIEFTGQNIRCNIRKRKSGKSSRAVNEQQRPVYPRVANCTASALELPLFIDFLDNLSNYPYY